MKIENSGVLVELTISTWSAQKLDRKATHQVTANANASAKSGKFTKDLLAGSTYASDITSFAGTTRNWNIATTLPWSNKGPRYCASTLFLSYKQEINSLKGEFTRRIKLLEQNYEKAKIIAQRELGAMFNPNDYPPIDVVLAKYGWSFQVSPIPLSGHFAVDMPKEDLAEFNANIEKKTKAAMEHAGERLRNTCADMSKKLATGQRFHDSFITNPQELCTFLTHVNITNDPALDDARKKLELSLTGVDLDDLKKHEDARQDLKTKIDAIFGAPTPTVSATTCINNPPPDVGTLQDLLTDAEVMPTQPVPPVDAVDESAEYVSPFQLSDW